MVARRDCYRSSSTKTRMILFILIPLVFFSITLWRRELGVVAVLLLLPAYLLRTTVAGIPTTLLEVSIYGVVLAVGIRALMSRQLPKPHVPRWFIILGVAWIVAWIIATIFSTDHQASLGALKAWLIDPLLYGTALLVTIHTPRQRALLLQGAAMSGTIVALAGIVQMLWYRTTLQDGRLSSFFAPVANYAAMFLVPLLVIVVGAILWKQLRPRWWFSVALMSIAVILTVSFGGYLALGAGLLILWLNWPNRRQRGVAMMLAGVVLLLGIGLLTKTPYLAEKITASDRSSSLVRSQIWRTSVEMIRHYPLAGIGPNAYENIYRETIPHLYFPPLEWLVSQPHQLYLALWLETGLLGLLTFFVFIVYWFRSAWMKITSRDAYSIISAAALTTILVHGFVDTPLFKNDLMVIFVVIVILPFLRQEK